MQKISLYVYHVLSLYKKVIKIVYKSASQHIV